MEGLLELYLTAPAPDDLSDDEAPKGKARQKEGRSAPRDPLGLASGPSYAWVRGEVTRVKRFGAETTGVVVEFARQPSLPENVAHVDSEAYSFEEWVGTCICYKQWIILLQPAPPPSPPRRRLTLPLAWSLRGRGLSAVGGHPFPGPDQPRTGRAEDGTDTSIYVVGGGWRGVGARRARHHVRHRRGTRSQIFTLAPN